MNTDQSANFKSKNMKEVIVEGPQKIRAATLKPKHELVEESSEDQSVYLKKKRKKENGYMFVLRKLN